MHQPNQDLQNLKFSCLYLFPFAQKVVPQFVPYFGPQIKFSHILMHRPYRDLQNLKFSCLYLFQFSHKVVPQKASGGGGGRGSGGGSYTTLQLVNIWGWQLFFLFFFFSFFFEPGLKLDEKSIENGLEGQKFLVVCLFWGGCQHPY